MQVMQVMQALQDMKGATDQATNVIEDMCKCWENVGSWLYELEMSKGKGMKKMGKGLLPL